MGRTSRNLFQPGARVYSPLSHPRWLAFEAEAGVEHSNLCRKETAVLVEMELSRIIISEINDQQVVYLREVGGERSFPILIGIFEATSINRRLTAPSPPRPLTHDLLKSVVTELGAELQDIVVTSMVDHTYYAVLRVKTADGEMIEVDSRPSDAIALAVHHDPVLPIFVDDSVLETVA